MSKIVSALSPLYMGLLSYLCDEVGLSFRWRAGTNSLLLRRDPSQKIEDPNLLESLLSNSERRPREIIGRKKLKRKARKMYPSALRRLKRKEDKKKGSDAMYRRLPGSF